jgi:hypothetical protein
MTLAWKRLSDTRKASECNRYVVDRQPCYANYPAMDYEYVAKHAANLQTDPLGTFETFELAAEACLRDLINQLTQKGK